MKRKFRLTKSNDFQRVRRNGRSYAHPLIVLVIHPQEVKGHSRVGISAGRSVGSAVRRNKAKRMLREAMRFFMPDVKDGWDIILLSRHNLPDTSYLEIRSALQQLLSRAGLFKETYGM